MPNSESDNKETRVYSIPLSQAGRLDEGMDRIVNQAELERYELPVDTARKVALGLVAMLAIFCLWTAFARVDIVASAPGQLRPYGKPKLIQSELSGKIRKIEVSEGEHVYQNEVLVELDPSIYKEQLDQKMSEAKKERIKLKEMEAARDAFESILKTPTALPSIGSDIDQVSQTINDVYSTQKALVQAKYDASTNSSSSSKATQPPGEMSDLTDMLTQLAKESEEEKQQIALLRSQNEKEESQRKHKIESIKQQLLTHAQMLEELNQDLNLSRQQEKDYAKVIDVGVSQVQYLDIKQKTAEASKKVLEEKNTISTLQNDLDFQTLDLPRWKIQCQNEILKAQTEIINTASKKRDIDIRMRSSTKDLDQAQAKADAALERARAALSGEEAQIATQKEAVTAADDSTETARRLLDKMKIQAPMTGTISNIAVRAPGQVVSPGEQLMQILPDRGEIIVEANVRNSDIGFVHRGQDVKLKLDAFPYQDFGILHGTVAEIEPYPESDKNGYLVRIMPLQMEVVSHGTKIPLKEGMTANCDIILRKMTILQALLRPFMGVKYMNMKS